MIPKNEVRNQILLLFRIFINDIDEDGSSSWSEKYLWGLDPLEWSTDGDNIPDGYEVIHNLDPHHYSNEESNDLDSDALIDKVEYDNRRHGSTPNRKDIFVEVDWMVKVRKYIYSWTYVPQLGGGGEWEPLYITKKTSYKMKEKAQFPVIKAFSRNNIGLHIDDGCMGGGGSLNKFDEKFTDSVKNALSSNTYGTGSNRGFDHTKDNFYYCVFAYKNKEGSSTAYGTAYSVPGYYFVVYDANTNNRNQKQETEFMHELGHHLHGYNNPKYSYAYNPAASHLTKANSDTNDHNAHCPNDCSLKSSSDCGLFEIRPVDYCDECWNSIRLDGRDGSYL